MRDESLKYTATGGIDPNISCGFLDGFSERAHAREKDCAQQNSKAWEMQPASMPERGHEKTRREVACDSVKRSSCSRMHT